MFLMNTVKRVMKDLADHRDEPGESGYFHCYDDYGHWDYTDPFSNYGDDSSDPASPSYAFAELDRELHED